MLICCVIDFEDLVIYTVNGLPSTYNIFKTSLRTRSQTLTFDELHILMKAEETALEKQSKIDESVNSPNLAMTANLESQRRSWKLAK